MNQPPQSQVFLERASYRQRRLTDAARFLPILGILLWSIPLLWPAGKPDSTSNADAWLYIFGIWVLLIGLSAVIVRKIDDDSPSSSDPPD